MVIGRIAALRVSTTAVRTEKQMPARNEHASHLRQCARVAPRPRQMLDDIAGQDEIEAAAGERQLSSVRLQQPGMATPNTESQCRQRSVDSDRLARVALQPGERQTSPAAGIERSLDPVYPVFRCDTIEQAPLNRANAG